MQSNLEISRMMYSTCIGNVLGDEIIYSEDTQTISVGSRFLRSLEGELYGLVQSHRHGTIFIYLVDNILKVTSMYLNGSQITFSINDELFIQNMDSLENIYIDEYTGFVYFECGLQGLWQYDFNKLTQITITYKSGVEYFNSGLDVIVQCLDDYTEVGNVRYPNYELQFEYGEYIGILQSEQNSSSFILINIVTQEKWELHYDFKVRDICTDNHGNIYGIGVKTGEYVLFYNESILLHTDCSIEINYFEEEWVDVKISSAFKGIAFKYLCFLDLPSYLESTYVIEHVDKISLGIDGTYLVKPKSYIPVEVVISFHGGPESFETLDNRYGALYWNLISLNRGVVVANYPGSITFSEEFSKGIYGNWYEEISKYYQYIENKLLNLGIKKVTFIGGSFGAMVLSICASISRLKIESIILIAPLLDINTQISRAKNSEYEKWFTSKYSHLDRNSLVLKNFMNLQSPKTVLIYGNKDEVLGTTDYKKLVDNLKLKDQIKIYCECESGHFPNNRITLNNRFNYIVNEAL